MGRSVGLTVPLGGLAAGILALALWVSAVALGWLDLVVLLLLTGGLAAALVGYLRGADARTRQIGVIAVGWNAFGLALLLFFYAAG